MEIHRALWQFITTQFYPGEDFVLGEDTSLIDSGLIDSTGVLELLTFLESEFGITVDDAEVVPENLDSLARITAFVLRKQAEATPKARPA
ncbi:acyl carrier protein [Hyalangium versicolor]|uniref:acyl carrier protein n=1 Tax=Hyalangium versicolor TaxID=2861190 RepID=UPI001CCDF87F|nr:acyl carrier protein [Hyalangium versicolor]